MKPRSQYTLLSLYQKKSLEELLKKGYPFTEIARLINSSINTIHTEVRLGGGREHYNAELSEQRKSEAIEKISINNPIPRCVIKRLTFEEREIIEKLNRQGLSSIQIAKVINRSKNAVLTELRHGGGAENYTAIAGAEMRHKIQLESRKKIGHCASTQNGKLRVNTEMVENLQMQIEILLDEIQKLKHQGKE